MYELGKGVPENWTEAVRPYTSSAGTYHEGAFALARMYEFGMGVPQDRAQAIEWFKKAAKLGHPKGASWARWLNDYSNCIGFRNETEQKTLGFLRCPADPVGVTFRNNAERLAYMRTKAKEFDRIEAEARAAQAARHDATSESACNSAGGTWSPERNYPHGSRASWSQRYANHHDPCSRAQPGKTRRPRFVDNEAMSLKAGRIRALACRSL